MLKKGISLFLALVMALGMIPTETMAATALVSNEGSHYEETMGLQEIETTEVTSETATSTAAASENQAGPLYYSVNEDGTTCSIIDCDGNISGDLEIPAEINGYIVTGIANGAFYGCSSLESIIIPEGVTYIGYNAFMNCHSLESIVIPEGVKGIGYSAFLRCSSLKNIAIPEGVTSIFSGTFSGCSSLESVTIPAGVNSIGDSAFHGCSALESIIIPAGVAYIHDGAFSECSALQNVIIHEGIINIGASAFFGCSSLESITIPKGTISIGDSAFRSCSSLKSAIIQQGVTSIGSEAFSDCFALKDIEIPDTVTSIGDHAFNSCRALISVVIPEAVTSISTGIFSGCSSLEYVTISERAINIGEYAFSGCSSLKNVTIPEAVTSIGAHAFSGCSSLKNITIPEAVTSIDEYAFYGCSSLKSVVIPEGVTSIMWYAFSGCTALESVIIPEGVTYIWHNAFSYCSSLKSITIPNGVTDIWYDAFSYCSSLESIIMPKDVVYIGEQAFYGCAALKDVYYAGTQEERENIIIEQIDSEATELLQATWHYNSTGPADSSESQDSLQLCYFSEWDAENQIAYFEDDLLHLGAEVTEETDTSFLDSVQEMLNQYVLVETRSRNDGMVGPDILISMEPVEAGTGTVQERTEDSLTVNDIIYPLALKGEDPVVGADKRDEVLYGVQDGKIVILVPLTTTTMRLEDWDPDSRVLTVSSDLTTYTYKVSTLASEESLAFLNADREPDKSYNIEFAYDLSGKSVYRIYRIYMESGDEDTSYKDGTFEYLSYDNHIREYTYHYDESWFWNSSYTYQHDLTRMSLRVAMAAGDIRMVDGQAAADGARPLKNLMSDLGFTYSEEYSHYPIPEYDSIGYGIGSKTITSSSGEKATLIMVAIRGSGYGAEWGGNFRVGTGIDHEGFRLAADQVINGIENYLIANQEQFQNTIKIWISGYSRAGATTNLVAAYLDDGFIEQLDPDNVFAFCFECPQNTTNNQASNVIYDNIVSIVNPIDLVPKVAMSAWGFRRFGMTYYLPGAETRASYSTLKQDMQLEYSAILAYLLDGGSTQDAIEKLKVLDLTREEPGQASALNDLADNIAVMLIDSQHYAKYYEDDVVATIGEILGHGINTDNLGEIVQGIPALAGNIFPVLCQYKVINGNDLSTIGLKTHYMELTLAWLDSLDGLYQDDYGSVCRRVFINCPVDVAVYDSNSRLVANISCDMIAEIENGIGAYIDSNGQKVIVLPTDDTYTIQLTATDNGTMTYTVTEYDIDSGNDRKVVSYYDVAISKGDKLYGTVENLTNASDAQYSLISPGGEPIAPTVTQTGSEIETYTVNVSSVGGGSVLGGGIFTSGEYAKVVATPDEEYVFDGWYIGNRLVSKDLEYRFLVDGNITISAVFVENSTSHTMTYVEAIQATCCSTGILAHWHCSKCNKDFSDADGTTELSSIVIPIDPTNHSGGTEVRNAVEATYESEGYTGDTYCLGCNTKIADGTTIPKKTQSGSTSGGGGTSTYTITLEEFENGTVTASHKQAPHGTTVTLTITPEEGFTLESLTVHDRNDNMIRVTSQSETIYSFTMPSSPVQIGAVFSQAINDPDTPLSDLPFLDVSSEAWYKNAVGYVFENGLMSGTSSTTFSPDITTSRGMIVTTLYRLEQSASVSGSSGFHDVEDSQWYSDAIAWASANDIVSGYGNGMFGPDDPVTREQMATILYRYVQFKGYPTTSSADLSKYTDLELLSTWAQEPMKWANVFGIITGTTATTLNPQGKATRAEMAAMLMRFCENVAV